MERRPGARNSGEPQVPNPEGAREGTVLLLLDIAGSAPVRPRQAVRPWRNAGPAKIKEKPGEGAWHKHPCFCLILSCNLPSAPHFDKIEQESGGMGAPWGAELGSQGHARIAITGRWSPDIGHLSLAL